MRKLLFQAAAIALTLACVTGLAQAEGWKLDGKELNPWTIVKKPGISSAWKKAVASAKVPKNEQLWVLEMPGPGSAETVAGPGGRQLVVGDTCRPHDCYDNNLVFAVDLESEKIWAVRQGRGQAPKARQFIGNPDAEMQKFLVQLLEKGFPA